MRVRIYGYVSTLANTLEPVQVIDEDPDDYLPPVRVRFDEKALPTKIPRKLAKVFACVVRFTLLMCPMSAENAAYCAQTDGE